MEATENNNSKSTLLDSTMTFSAKAVSIIMHPFLLPIYAVLFLVYSDPILALSPLRLKLFLVSAVTLNVLIVPGMSVVLLKTSGYLSDLYLNNHRDRIIPLIIVIIAYAACVYMVSGIFFAFMVRKYMIVALCCAVISLIITFFWKISLHMVAAGAFIGVLATLAFTGVNAAFWLLLICLVLTGALASARLFLGKHNPPQVAAGFFTGLIVAFASLLLL